jgi:hypothetical protein
MNTLLTPGDVPKSKPKTNLWLNHCALLDLPTKNSGILRLALPIKVATSPARFGGRRTGTIGSPYFLRALRSTGIDAISITTEPKQRDLAHSFNRPFT